MGDLPGGGNVGQQRRIVSIEPVAHNVGRHVAGHHRLSHQFHNRRSSITNHVGAILAIDQRRCSVDHHHAMLGGDLTPGAHRSATVAGEDGGQRRLGGRSFRGALHVGATGAIVWFDHQGPPESINDLVQAFADRVLTHPGREARLDHQLVGYHRHANATEQIGRGHLVIADQGNRRRVGVERVAVHANPVARPVGQAHHPVATTGLHAPAVGIGQTGAHVDQRPAPVAGGCVRHVHARRPVLVVGHLRIMVGTSTGATQAARQGPIRPPTMRPPQSRQRPRRRLARLDRLPHRGRS